MQKVFREDQLEILSSKVRKLLGTVGYRVQHEVFCNLLNARGVKQSASGRYLFDNTLINEFVEFQKRQLHKNSEANKLSSAKNKTCDCKPIGSHKVFRTGFGNWQPKFYDYANNISVPSESHHLEMLAKFAHSDERVVSIGISLSLTDVPIETAPIEAFLILSKFTDKFNSGLDPYCGKLVKYLVELSDVFLGSGQQNRFVDPADCINPIMRLEERTAEVMIQRAKYGIDSRITSMPTAGGNAPVTLDGTVIQGAAEIVGGMILSYLLNPEVDHRGTISSSAIDMKSAVTTQSSPESVLVDCGVVELMNHAFGGNTSIGGTTFVAATQPGLVAVFEKLFKTAAYQKYTGTLSYCGAGVLDNGALMSVEQLLIDMDISEAFFHLDKIELQDEPIEEIIAEVAGIGNADFLSTNHTLDNYLTALWHPSLLLRGATRTEQSIIASAHEKFEAKLKSYAGYACDEQKMRHGQDILNRAKKELGIAIF